MSWYFNLECCAYLTSNIKPWCSESWEAPWDNIQTPISWRWSCNPGTHLVIQILHNTSNWVFQIYGGSGSCQHAKGTLRESQQKLVGNVILYWSDTRMGYESPHCLLWSIVSTCSAKHEHECNCMGYSIWTESLIETY